MKNNINGAAEPRTSMINAITRRYMDFNRTDYEGGWIDEDYLEIVNENAKSFPTLLNRLSDKSLTDFFLQPRSVQKKAFAYHSCILSAWGQSPEIMALAKNTVLTDMANLRLNEIPVFSLIVNMTLDTLSFFDDKEYSVFNGFETWRTKSNQ